MPRKHPTPARAELTASRPLFPPEQAFVVHFRSDGDTSGERCAGRVEHVVSGRSARFQSPPALLAFMRKVLRGVGRTREPRRHPGSEKHDAHRSSS